MICDLSPRNLRSPHRRSLQKKQTWLPSSTTVTMYVSACSVTFVLCNTWTLTPHYPAVQSEPEEMPPEAKMRMKNIGRCVPHAHFSRLELIHCCDQDALSEPRDANWRLILSGRHPHLPDPILSTKASRDSRTTRSCGRGRWKRLLINSKRRSLVLSSVGNFCMSGNTSTPSQLTSSIPQCSIFLIVSWGDGEYFKSSPEFHIQTQALLQRQRADHSLEQSRDVRRWDWME